MAREKDVIIKNQERVMVSVAPTPGVDPDKDYKDVCINGEIFRVKCGESVMVPRAVAERLRHARGAMVQITKMTADMSKGSGRKLE